MKSCDKVKGGRKRDKYSGTRRPYPRFCTVACIDLLSSANFSKLDLTISLQTEPHLPETSALVVSPGTAVVETQSVAKSWLVVTHDFGNRAWLHNILCLLLETG